MPSLIVTSGALTGQVFSFSETAVVGRGQFSDVRINDPTVSRRHAQIRAIGADFELSDQDSANGTRWRGQRIDAPVRIVDGDEIEFGEVKTTFRIAAGNQDSLPSNRPPPPREAAAGSPRSGETGAMPMPAPPPAAVAPGLRELLSRLKLFCDIGALARREEPLREQLLSALDALLAGFPHARCAAVYASDAGSSHLAVIAARSRSTPAPDLAHADAFLREALRHETGIAVVDATNRAALAARLQIAELPPAVLGMPIRTGAQTLGALYLDSVDAAHAWRAGDQELFIGVAGQLGWLIAAQRGQSPERAIETHDLALARRIQQRFLPQSPPDLGGWRFADSYAAARVIGGDYFDYFHYRDGRTGVVIADVSGKSVSGALYMARLSVQVRALARHMGGPGELLAGLNRKLYQELEPGMFVTMLAAALEPEHGALEFALAGHPPPLLRKPDGQVEELAAAGAVPLGAMSDAQFAQSGATLTPGACVLFYTDGLDEAHNESDALFGKARIVEALAQPGDAQDVLDSLLAAVARFTAGEAQSDDLTLIAISRNR